VVMLHIILVSGVCAMMFDVVLWCAMIFGRVQQIFRCLMFGDNNCYSDVNIE